MAPVIASMTILSGATPMLVSRMLSCFAVVDAASVAELIKDEHPQIIATILVHLDRDQAAEVLGALRPSGCATTWCCASPRSTAYSPRRCAI